MITAKNDDVLSNSAGDDIYDRAERPGPANGESATSDVLQEDDLHEVQVNDDLNEPDAETAAAFDKNNTSTPDEVQGEGTDLDSMDDGSTGPATDDTPESE